MGNVRVKKVKEKNNKRVLGVRTRDIVILIMRDNFWRLFDV